MIKKLVLAGAVLVVVVLVGGGLASFGNMSSFDTSTFAEGVDRAVARAEQVRAAASPDYQRTMLTALPPSPTVGEFYRLDDLVGEANVLEEPVRTEEYDAFETVFGYPFDQPGEVVSATGAMDVRVEDGLIKVEVDSGDYLHNAEAIEIPRDDIGEVAVRLRAQSGKNLRLGWSKEAEPSEVWGNSLSVPIVADGEFHTYFVNLRQALSRGLNEGDRIRALMIGPSDVDGDEVELDFFRLISTRSAYMRKPRGVVYETIAGEVRQALYMLPRQVLEYTLRVPEDEPRIDFGTGVIGVASAVEFRVEVSAGGETEILHAETLEDSSRWRDARYDLSNWAGQDIALTLTVDGQPGSVALWSNPIVSSRPQKPLRIIVLLEDAMRADRLSAYGHDRATTPFKDELFGQKGIVFEHAFTQAEQTRPSVPSLMTSLLPTATGVWNFKDMLGEEYLTVAEVLRDAGFATASFVQNGNAGPYAGLHQGFEASFAREEAGASAEDLLLSDTLAQWLERHRDRNFFLYLHILDPHGPYDPPEPQDEWYASLAPGEDPQSRDASLDPEWTTQPTRTGRLALYDGEIRHNDEIVGQFFARLRAADLADDSAFWFIADHGEHFGEHGVWEHQAPGTTQVTRVPMALVYPQRFAGGQRVSEAVQLIDLMPTVLELAEIPTDALAMQGDSLVSLLEGGDPSFWRDRVAISIEATELDKAHPGRNDGLRVSGSLIYRDWHLIASRAFWPGRKVIPESLRLRVYDYVADPQERSPLLRYRPDLYLRYQYTSGMNRLYDAGVGTWNKFTGGGVAGEYQFDPATLDQLKALGYIDD